MSSRHTLIGYVSMTLGTVIVYFITSNESDLFQGAIVFSVRGEAECGIRSSTGKGLSVRVMNDTFHYTVKKQ